MMLGTCRQFPPKPYEFTTPDKFPSINCRNSLASQAFLQFQAPRHQAAWLLSRRLVFDLFLQLCEFFLHTAAAKEPEAVFSGLPDGIGEGLKKYLKQQAAIFFLQRCTQFGWAWSLASCRRR